MPIKGKPVRLAGIDPLTAAFIPTSILIAVAATVLIVIL